MTVANKYLITGATGFIGSRLCQHLAERGDDVTAAVRNTSSSAALAGTGVRRVEVDFETGGGLRTALRDVDRVVHLAGVVKAATVTEFGRGNAGTTRTLVRALAELPHPPRLVVCSSLAAAGPSYPGSPRTEVDPVRPVSWYGLSKLAAEQAARAYAERVPTVLVRPPIVYGPGDPAFLPSLLAMIRLGVVLKAGAGQRWYSMIHVDDHCRLLLLAADRGRTVGSGGAADGVYFASDGAPRCWQTVCEATATAGGYRRPRIVSAPDAVVRMAGLGASLVGRARGEVGFLNADKARELRCSSWVCGSDKARRELGFVPRVSLVEGLGAVLQDRPAVAARKNRSSL